MAAELFIGNPNVQYVEQPPGSEQCFAAIISSLTGAQIHESQAALYQAGLVEENGTVAGLWFETNLEVNGSSMTINPLEAPEDPEAVLDLLEEQFQDGTAVALLHKKNANIEEDGYHWILLTGLRTTDGAIHVINPLPDSKEAIKPEPGEEAGYLARGRIIDLIKQSTNYQESSDGTAKATGIFPHAISVTEQ